MRDTLQKIHEFLQRGQNSQARALLKKIFNAAMERDYLLSAANLARRADLPEIAVRSLFPFVRLEKNPRQSATESERAEYAASLIKLGAVGEGISLLKEIDARLHPEALIFLAYGHIKEWNYHEAITLYERYLSFPGLTQHQKETVRFNLAASLLQDGQTTKANLFLSQEKDLPKSLRDLIELHSISKRHATSETLTRLSALKRDALKNEQWEFLRQSDLVEAIVTKNETLKAKLYVGSPFTAFRERVEAAWPTMRPLPESYDWNLGQGIRAESVVNLLEKLKPGQAQSHLLAVLLSDFYRPFQTARISELLFKGENYDPYHTANRVQQTIARLRKTLRATSLPISIQEQAGAYSLTSSRNLGVKVVLQPTQSAWDYSIQLLMKRFEGEFDAKSAAEVLKCSSDTVVIYLNRAILDGLCERQGRGRSTKYCFKNRGVAVTLAA